jgi:predicted nucleic acid-binding protein
VIVVDASVALVALMNTGHHGVRANAALAADLDWYAPGVLQHEVLYQLREIVVKCQSDPDKVAQAAVAAQRFGTWAVRPVDSGPLVARVWALRDNVDAGDALYVAAAELLGCPLLTNDLKLTRATGPRCEFRVPS